MTRRRSSLWVRFTASLAFCHGVLFATDTVNISELRAHCASDAPLITLETIIRAESGGNPNAIQLDYPATILRRWRFPKGRLQFDRQPRDAAEAIAWMNYLSARGISVDLGLMQVSTAEAKRRHIRVADLLDTCTNVRVGWSIFREDYTAVPVFGRVIGSVAC
jgi:type IV secretion system protein VirB1